MEQMYERGSVIGIPFTLDDSETIKNETIQDILDCGFDVLVTEYTDTVSSVWRLEVR